MSGDLIRPAHYKRSAIGEGRLISGNRVKKRCRLHIESPPFFSFEALVADYHTASFKTLPVLILGALLAVMVSKTRFIVFSESVFVCWL